MARALQEFYLRGDFVRCEQIVGIEKLNEGTLREPQAVVARRAGTAVRLRSDAHAAQFEAPRDAETFVA